MEFIITEKQKQSSEIDGEQIYETILEQLSEKNQVEMILDREDFVKELSTDVGIGFQDLKEKYKYATQMLMTNKKIDISFEPTENFSLDNIEMKIILSYK